MRYLRYNLIAVTQFLNTLAGGYPDESTSSRAWRQRHEWHWGIIRQAIDAAFFWELDHCFHAYYAERERRRRHHDLR